MAHVNNVLECPGCNKLFNAYPNFDELLKKWFWEKLRTPNFEVHISCAGRGYVDQEAAFDAGKSRAHFGQSAHNYNMAIDIFRLCPDSSAQFAKDWYETVLTNRIPSYFLWYGNEGPYREYPHVERRGWEAIVRLNKLEPVK